MDDWVGRTIDGRYEVTARLGSGGMAAVYRAQDRRLNGRAVALKHPLRDTDRAGHGLTDADLRERFQGEVAKLIDLDAIEGVVPIRDQGEHDGVPYFVMPLMDGGSLEERLHAGPQSLDEILEWAQRVAAALDGLHARRPPVLHRDVKPSNILFDGQNRAHLADFGIVKELNAAWATTGPNTGLGTPGFMPPEQMLPTRMLDATSDQYALAATIYRALAGRMPLYETGGTAVATSGRARKRLRPVNAHDLASHVPVHVAAALERALSEDQEARFPTCADLVAALGAPGAVAPDTSASAPVGLPQRTPSEGREAGGGRGRARAAFALVVVVVGCGIAVLKSSERPGSAPTSRPTEADLPGASRTTGLDRIAPVVVVEEPEAGEIVTSLATITVKGRVTDVGGPLRAVTLSAGAMDVALDGEGRFQFDVLLAPDAENTIRLVATDGAGNRSPPIARTIRREPESAAVLREALAGLAAKDGEAIRAALAKPAAAEIPVERLKDAIEFLHGWDSPPSLEVMGIWPADGDVVAGRPRAMTVVGRLYPSRRGERAVIDGRDMTTASGSGFEGQVERTRPGTVEIPWEIRHGSRLRASGTFPVTFGASPAPSPAWPAWAHELVSAEQNAEAARLGKPVAFEEPAAGLRFVLVPGGTFRMGAPSDENYSNRDPGEGPQHDVTLSSFYLAMHEVTNQQFRRFRATHDSGSYLPNDGTEKGKPQALNADLQPVVRVNHEDALSFIAWLSGQARTKGFRLPTEAQWEYACRAGTTTAQPWSGGWDAAHLYANGNDPEATRAFGFSMEGWPHDDGHRVTAPVGRYRPNAWGLHDMIGNVWEWCADGRRTYAAQAVQDPEGRTSNGLRAIRGGSWADSRFAGRFRSASRLEAERSRRDVFLGFRVALPASSL